MEGAPARARRPPLYRLARMFRILGNLAIIFIVIYVALAIYSATKIRPSSSTGSSPNFVPSPNGTLLVTAKFALSNPGYFAIDNVRLEVATQLPDPNGTRLFGSSPPVEVPAGSSATVPVTFALHLDRSAAILLLTHDLRLPGRAWVNATYAGLFGIHLSVQENLSWGAPFEALNASTGSPVPNGNGTTSVPITLSFSNHASFAVQGAVLYRVVESTGTACASGSFPVDAAPGAAVSAIQTVYVPAGCNPRGGVVTLAFQGNLGTLALPSQSIP